MDYTKDTIEVLKERLRIYEGLNALDLHNKYQIKLLEKLIKYAIEIIPRRIKEGDYAR